MIKIQGLIVFLVFIIGPEVITYLKISDLYLYLFKIDTIAAGLLVLFLGLLNILFYLDKRREALLLAALFAVSNICFTAWTLHLGVFYFGYGFAASLLLTNIITMFYLDTRFKDLEYETFMLC